MADKLDDPHHLVALMSYVLWKQTDSSPRYFDPSLRTPGFGIVDNKDTNVRTFPILDALANISVSQERSQVVAIGLQLNSRTNQIRLTVAENNNVEDGLVPHLKKIWGKLQALSNEYAEKRILNSEVSQVGSPEMPPKVGLSLKIEIFRDIYQYSLSKQMKRITRWFQPFVLFAQEFLSRQSADQGESRRRLFNIVGMLGSVVNMLRENLRDSSKNPLTPEEWETVYHTTKMVNQDAKLLLAEKGVTSCEMLALNLHGDRPGEPFRLRRALEKLTSLSRHIGTLFGFAHSPRLRPALQSDLVIFPVPGQVRTVKLPVSHEEWGSFFEAARGEYDDDRLAAQAVGFLKRFGLEEWVCPVHSECGLIQYLQTKRENEWDNVPPFGCIGVSKLSCSACRIWMEVFNEQDNGPKFFTRGSHGKWYWPWGMPRARGFLEEEGSLEKRVATKVLHEYRAHLLAKKHQRAGSDSTDASSSGARDVQDPDDVALSRAWLAMRTQATGGTWIGLVDAVVRVSQEP